MYYAVDYPVYYAVDYAGDYAGDYAVDSIEGFKTVECNQIWTVISMKLICVIWLLTCSHFGLAIRRNTKALDTAHQNKERLKHAVDEIQRKADTDEQSL